MLLEAAVAPEEGARHGGGDNERIEQHTTDNRLVDKPAITDLAREIRQKLGAGVACRLAPAWRVRSRGRKRKLHRQPEAVLGDNLTWIKMRIESCSILFTMGRIVVWFLIVSLLTLNMAWAVDNCAFSDPSDSNAGLAQTLDPAPANSTNTIPTCNHWCPGWMSLVALPGSSTPLPSLLLADFDGRIWARMYFFLPAPPPTHPPIG